MDRERPIILAMQGYPSTGKTTVARSLVETLNWPLIDYDGILDVLAPLPPPSEEDAEALFTQAFEVVIHVVKTHVSLGFSVIVDSPLYRCSDLDKLQSLMTALRHQSPPKVCPSLVIVDCKPKTRYVWETRFLELEDEVRDKWYKYREFSEVLNKLVENRSTFHQKKEKENSTTGSKVIVDTTDEVRPDLLAEAVRDLAADQTKPDAVCRVLELKEWILIRYEGPLLRLREGGTGSSLSKGLCTDGHHLNVYREDGIGHYALCGACGERVQTKSPAYTCKLCSLAIHKSCAELSEAPNRRVSYSPADFPKFYIRDLPQGQLVCPPLLDLATFSSYCFPEEHLCPRCRLQGNDFSYDCASCIYQSHLRCGLIPTVLDHEGHLHPLFFWARPVSGPKRQYQCGACKLPGEHVAYGCAHGCDVNYHPECALLPNPRLHIHGGYEHEMHLMFSSEEMEDYMCDMCGERTNPDAWYYYCSLCYLTLHLDCIDIPVD